MIFRKVLFLTIFLLFLLLAAACTAKPEPVADPTAVVIPTPTIEPTSSPEVTSSPSPTPVSDPTIEPEPEPTETATAVAQFSELPIQDEQPAPIGLLYSQPEGGIWQIGVDGQPQQLTAQPSAVPSPDGHYAFYKTEGDLWLIELATVERTRLIGNADGEYLARHEQWIDNDTIFVAIWHDLETEEGPNVGHPALIDVSSGELTLLDDDRLMGSYPAMSTSGAIAYSSVGQSAADKELTWIYRPETGATLFNPTDFDNAVTGFYTSPAWSADGRFLAWLVFNGNNITRIAVFDMENNTVINLPPFQSVGFGGPYPNPVFSKDANWVALRQFSTDPAATGVWLYPLNEPLPDGQNLLFIAQNGGDPLWLNEQLLLFTGYDENFNDDLQQYDVRSGVRSAITLPEVNQIFGIVAP